MPLGFVARGLPPDSHCASAAKPPLGALPPEVGRGRAVAARADRRGGRLGADDDDAGHGGGDRLRGDLRRVRERCRRRRSARRCGGPCRSEPAATTRVWPCDEVRVLAALDGVRHGDLAVHVVLLDAHDLDGQAVGERRGAVVREAVVAVDGDTGLRERVTDGGGGARAGDRAAVGLHGERLGGADGQAHAVQRDVSGAAGRQGHAALSEPDLVEGLVDRRCGHPDRLRRAVDDQLQLARPAQGDLVAVVDGAVGRGDERVALAGLEPGGGEDVGGGVAAEVDRARLAVDDEGGGLLGRLVGDATDGGGGEDRGGDGQDGGAGRAGQQVGRGHGAPKVGRPGHTDEEAAPLAPRSGTGSVQPVVRR